MDLKFDYEEKKVTSRIGRKDVLFFIIASILVIGAAFAITTFVLEKTRVVGVSMEPILNESDKIIINKAAYLLKKPDRFDVIVFKKDDAEHKYYSVKRVIGLPGEKIKISDGIVYINGEKLTEKLKLDSIISAGVAEEELQLEKDEFFVLGDNRNQSEDSRYASIGIISKRDIIGKAWLRIAPSFGFISMLTIPVENNHAEEK